MKKNIILTLFGFLILFFGFSAAAPVPARINYQGILKDSAGLAVTNSSLSIKFSIYSGATGGSSLWTETQSVSVESGLYSVQLGSVTAIGPSVFDGSTRYLGIKVGTDSEMTPRLPLISVPYALRASSAEVAETVSDLSITSAKIGYQAVTEDKIDDDAVTSGKISTAAVSENKIQTYAVTSSKIHPAVNINTVGVVTADAFYGDGSGLTNVSIVSTIPDLSITATKLATNSVTSEKIQNSSVTPNKLNVTAIDSEGKLPALNSTYVTNMDGSTVTNVNASLFQGNSIGNFLMAGNTYAPSSQFGLRITSSSTLDAAVGLYGNASDTSATSNYGIYGNAEGTAGAGVYGSAGGAQGRGIEGLASNSGTGIHYGGYFSATGQNGVGAYTTVDGANAFGGLFDSSGSNGIGIAGRASHGTGNNIGGYFLTNSTAGTAVYGLASNSGASASIAGSFEARGRYGIGVFAVASDNSALSTNYGVKSIANNQSGHAIYAENSAATNGLTHTGSALFINGNIKVAARENNFVGSSIFGADNDSCTVNNTAVTTNSYIFIMPKTLPEGKLWVSSKNPGVSFTVSSEALESYTQFNYLIIN